MSHMRWLALHPVKSISMESSAETVAAGTGATGPGS
jgi:hypothetical protein